MKRIDVGLIGFGNWGRHHYRLLSSHPKMRVVGIYDPAYRGRRFARTPEDLIEKCDSVHVVVPAESLVPMAKRVLEHDRHLFIEKPIATRVEDARELRGLARKHPESRVMVGFIERFNPVFRRLHMELGMRPPDTIFCQRSGTPTLVARRAGVLVDLAIHDADLLLWTLGRPRRVVVNSNTDFYFGQLELLFRRTKAFVISDCLGPKVRRWVIRSRDKVIHADFRGKRWRLFLNDVEVPLRWREPLKGEIDYFISCIEDGAQPSPGLDDGVNALSVVTARA